MNQERTRRTSLQAYEEIRESGLLSKRRFEAFDALFARGPSTANELIAYVRARANDGDGYQATRSLHKRLSELVALGVAYEVRERKCTITGFRAIEFAVSGNLPEKPAPKKSKLTIARERIRALEAEVESLKAEISDLRRGGQREIFG